MQARNTQIATPIILPIFIVLTTLATVQAESTRSRLGALLPDACEGYRPEESWFCVGTTNLTYIHNGGYIAYVNRGVETAMMQTYTKDSSFYTATIYGMNTKTNASDIVEHYRSTYNAQPNNIGDGGFEHTSYGMNYLHFCLGDLYITLEGSGQSTMQCMRQAAQNILTKAVDETIPTAFISILGLILLPTHLRKHAWHTN